MTQAAPRRIARPTLHPPLALAPPPADLPLPVRNAALAAAGALAMSGRGDLWTLAVAFGVADASAVTALVVLLAGVATVARLGSAGLADIAGGQAVLGAAGFTGSTLAIAAVWASAVSLLIAARDRWTAIGTGALAGLLVAGPSLAGSAANVGVWIVAVAAGGAAGWFVAPTDRRLRWQPWVAVVVAVSGACLGLVAGYK